MSEAEWVCTIAAVWIVSGWIMSIGAGHRGARQSLGEHFGNALIIPLIAIVLVPFCLVIRLIEVIGSRSDRP